MNLQSFWEPWRSSWTSLGGWTDVWMVLGSIFHEFAIVLGALAVILDVFGSPKLKPLIFLGFSYDWECPRSKSRAKVEANYRKSGAIQQSIFKTSELEIKTWMIELIELIELNWLKWLKAVSGTYSSQPGGPWPAGAGGLYLIRSWFWLQYFI